MERRSIIVITRWPRAGAPAELFLVQYEVPAPARAVPRTALRCSEAALPAIVEALVPGAGARRDVLRRVCEDGRAVLRLAVDDSLVERHWPPEGRPSWPEVRARIGVTGSDALVCGICDRALGLGDALMMIDGALVHGVCLGPGRDVAAEVMDVLGDRPEEHLCQTCIAAAVGASVDEVRTAVGKLRVAAKVCLQTGACGSCAALRVTIAPAPAP